MKPYLLTTLATLLLLSGTLASAPLADKFKPPCGTFPYEDIKTTGLDVDEDCTKLEGAAGSAEGKLQNRAKNNFCAGGTPSNVSFSTFSRLQKAIDDEGDSIIWGSRDRLPPDRDVLKDVVKIGTTKFGEGKLVTFVGFIVSARNSNVSKGESVNCNKGKAEFNDIHIELGADPDADTCDTVSAEISPHFRPEAWEQIVDHDHMRRPIKVTGPLFFDASHIPCRVRANGTIKRASPARMTVWEVHPLYAIEVCKNKTLAGCPANKKSVWVPFHEFFPVEDDN